MDPRLLDLVWEAYRASGATDYIQVVCGYRSPATNSMLRSRSKGVAEKSQHMLGKAMDFYIPGVPLKKLRDIGLKMQGGGVGYYPTSGSPFVHMDVGNVRHWPRHQPPGTGQRCSRTARRCMCRATASRCPAMNRRSPPTRRARVPALPPSNWPAPAAAPRSPVGSCLLSLAAAATTRPTTAPMSRRLRPRPRPSRETVKPTATHAKSSNLPGIAIVAPEDAQRAEIPQVADDAGLRSRKRTRRRRSSRRCRRAAFRCLISHRVRRPMSARRRLKMFRSAWRMRPPPPNRRWRRAQAPASVPFGMAHRRAIAASFRHADPSAVPIRRRSPSTTYRCRPGVPTFRCRPILRRRSKDVLLALADTAEHDRTATDAFSVLPSRASGRGQGRSRARPARPTDIARPTDTRSPRSPSRARPSTTRRASMPHRRAMPSLPARPVPIRLPRSAPA